MCRRAAVWHPVKCPKRAGAHTQLNLLTKSYESRSVTVRGGCVCTRCVMYVRVWGLVHKVAPTQARLLCKTPGNPAASVTDWMHAA
jgi:hypothetical protein